MEDALTIASGMTATRNRNITDVINTYSKRLLGFIRSRVKSEEDAEDILQDVFYQFIGNAAPIEQISGWLFKVARNKITDGQRRMQPELIEDIYNADDDEAFEWSEIFFDDGNNPETEYLRTMFWEALNNALGELPAEQRDAFVLNEMEGIPFKILAEQTGETINTLLSRKRYAVLHLRKRLAVLRNELLNY
jgi:RNA polymerase sigma factor (sigma-70 family)